jgi:hypothetical protein
MTTLEYVKGSSPPEFITTGSEDLPAGVYTLGGKFPLTDKNDLYHYTYRSHTLNGKKVKLTGFTISCDIEHYSCSITVQTKSLKILDITDTTITYDELT